MVWTERQTAMLRAIGVRLWQPAALDAVADADDPAVAVAAARADAAQSDSVAPAPARGVTGLPAPQAAPRDAGQRPPPEDARSAVEPGDASDVGTPARRALDAPGPRAAPPLRVDIAPVPAAGGPVTPSVAARGAGLDWAALRSAVEGCDACALASSRTQTVFGVGHPQAHWMVVGEAPGEQEDLRGEPFVGAAGQLLDAMLRALALSREAEGPPERRVYIANTLKCRPPRNRNPAPDELLRCEGFLVRQIELVRPRIILAMGRFAVQALLRSDEPVGKLRGRVHRYQGVPLVVTYHPAYLLRNLPDKARAWEDLCMAAAVAERAGQGG